NIGQPLGFIPPLGPRDQHHVGVVGLQGRASSWPGGVVVGLDGSTGGDTNQREAGPELGPSLADQGHHPSVGAAVDHTGPERIRQRREPLLEQGAEPGLLRIGEPVGASHQHQDRARDAQVQLGQPARQLLRPVQMDGLRRQRAWGDWLERSLHVQANGSGRSAAQRSSRAFQVFGPTIPDAGEMFCCCWNFMTWSLVFGPNAPDSSKMRGWLSALAKSLRMCWMRAVASLSGGGTESGFKWGSVRLTWTAGFSAMTSSR